MLSLGIKWPAYEGDHLYPSSTKLKNKWSYTPAPRICLDGVYMDNFTFTSYVDGMFKKTET
jgi:hypothetical protein